MTTPRTQFWADNRGPDLIEYRLMRAFVSLAPAGLFPSAGGSIRAIRPNSHSNLNVAAGL